MYICLSWFKLTAFGVLCIGTVATYESGRRDPHDGTMIGDMYNSIQQIPALPVPLGLPFRPPCKDGEICYKSIRRLMVPKLGQLENLIMSVMKDLASMPPGSRLPDKISKTEPLKLMLDGNYKEPVCAEKDIEACAQQDRRRRRILKKLFLKKYSNMRSLLVGYGGRNLWGGEANLFYR